MVAWGYKNNVPIRVVEWLKRALEWLILNTRMMASRMMITVHSNWNTLPGDCLKLPIKRLLTWEKGNGNSSDGANGQRYAHQELGWAEILHQPEEKVVEESPKKSGHEEGEEEGHDVAGAQNLSQNKLV